MRLIALLSWFDEQPAWLAELVASMGRARVDHLVAVDGAYALYPQARGSSGSEQAEVVTATALGAGMGVTVHVPQHPWIGNELEKRSWLFAAGHLTAHAGDDWLWVCDADEVIETAAGLREQLEATPLDVAELMLVEHLHDGGDAVSRQPIRKVFRAHPAGITVQDAHYHYVDGDGRELWGPAQIPAEQLLDVRVRHRPAARAAHRDRSRHTYYRRRDDFAAEAMLA